MAAHLRNRGGVMHGGALFSLMDVTMGLACSSSHGFDRQSVTLECKINYIRAVADGEVRCVARVLHAGRAAWLWKPRCGKATNWSRKDKVPSPSCKPARPPCGRMARNGDPDPCRAPASTAPAEVAATGPRTKRKRITSSLL